MSRNAHSFRRGSVYKIMFLQELRDVSNIAAHSVPRRTLAFVGTFPIKIPRSVHISPIAPASRICFHVQKPLCYVIYTIRLYSLKIKYPPFSIRVLISRCVAFDQLEHLCGCRRRNAGRLDR